MAVVSRRASDPVAVYRAGKSVVIDSHVGQSTSRRDPIAVHRLPVGSWSYVSKRFSISFLVNVRTPES